MEVEVDLAFAFNRWRSPKPNKLGYALFGTIVMQTGIRAIGDTETFKIIIDFNARVSSMLTDKNQFRGFFNGSEKLLDVCDQPVQLEIAFNI